MAVWGPTPDLYTLPVVRLAVEDAPWLADAAVTSWSLDRELVASVIPGNVRSRNGLSIGAASVNVVNTGALVTPWSPNPDRKVTIESQSAELSVEADDGDTLPLGAWVLNPATGSLATGQTTVDLLEAQYAARRKPQTLPAHHAAPFVSAVDACWIVGQMARRAGFAPVPAPVASAILSLPMHGSFTSVPLPAYPVSPYSSGGTVSEWTVLEGDVAVGVATESFAAVVGAAGLRGIPITDQLRVGASVFITANVVGTVHLVDYGSGWQIQIVNDPDTDTFTVAVCNSNDGTFTTPSVFTGQESADWPTRVQVEVQRNWDSTAKQWTNLQARARSGPAAAWSTWASDSTDHTPLADGIELLYFLAGTEQVDFGIVAPDPGQLAAMQFTTTTDVGLWEPSAAHLRPLGGDVGLPWVPPGMDMWTAIQDVCSAWLGATIMGADGVMRMLTRDDLAGVNNTGDVVDIGKDTTDLPWTLDPNDSADRIEVTFTPPMTREADLGSTTDAPAVWVAQEVIHVPPGATMVLDVAFENAAAVGVFETFIVPGDVPTGLRSQSSFVNVYSTPDGTGAPVPQTQIRVGAKQTSATTATITYRNASGASQYLVTDADLATGGGEPSLRLNANTVATYETPQMIERGLPAADAVRPLQVDLTPWVQRDEDATTIADYLWGRVSGSGLWKANSVRVKLDWAHDLGRILRLLHSATGLEAKALVTKVHMDGNAGEIAQNLDLVLLPWTYSDFAAEWEDADPGATYADFAAAQGTRTYADHQADPLWTGA